MAHFTLAGCVCSVVPIAGMLLSALLLQSASAQSVSFPLAAGEAGDNARDISCAPSNNGSGHLVCAEYVAAGSVVTGGAINGVAWLAPPTMPTPGTSALATPQPLIPLPKLVGAPSCAPRNDGNGTATCLGTSSFSIGGRGITTVTITFFGVSFYPVTPLTPSGLTLGRVSNTSTVGASPSVSTPSCVTTGNGAQVICAVTINGTVNGIRFDPISGSSTGLTSLASITTAGFVPACTSAPDGTDQGAALCIIDA
jgi:hypothetical protein